MKRANVRIDRQGRLTIPVRLRDAAGLAPGAHVTIEAVDRGKIVISGLDARIEEAETITRKYIQDPTGIVDAFLAERRKESERE